MCLAPLALHVPELDLSPDGYVVAVLGGVVEGGLGLGRGSQEQKEQKHWGRRVLEEGRGEALERTPLRAYIMNKLN